MSQWQHALGVLRDMQRLEVQPNRVCFSALIESMLDFQVPGAIALFRAMEVSKVSNVGIATRGGQALDLHGLTSELARMAVRVKLLDIAIAMTSSRNEFWKNPKHHGLQADGSLLLLVGLGQHSKTGEAILGPSLLQMLEEELGLQAHFHPSNEAMLMIPKHELLQLMKKCSQPVNGQMQPDYVPEPTSQAFKLRY